MVAPKVIRMYFDHYMLFNEKCFSCLFGQSNYYKFACRHYRHRQSYLDIIKGEFQNTRAFVTIHAPFLRPNIRCFYDSHCNSCIWGERACSHGTARILFENMINYYFRIKFGCPSLFHQFVDEDARVKILDANAGIKAPFVENSCKASKIEGGDDDASSGKQVENSEDQQDEEDDDIYENSEIPKTFKSVAHIANHPDYFRNTRDRYYYYESDEEDESAVRAQSLFCCFRPGEDDSPPIRFPRLRSSSDLVEDVRDPRRRKDKDKQVITIFFA